jgi:predicted O-methyltransferase YrrM
MGQQGQGHLRGIILRAKILKTLLTERNDSMLRIVSSLLDSIGIHYDGVNGNIDPFTFNDYVLPGGSHLNAVSQTPEFSACTNHNYVEEVKDLSEDWSCEPEVARFVGRLACRIEPVRIVEIGCFVGLTTAHLAQALSYLGGNRTVYGVDISDRFLNITQENLKALGLSHLFRPIHGASLDPFVLKCVPNDLDLVFIDSYHHYLNTLQEIEVYSQKLSSNGMMVLHDSIKWPGVRKAIAVFAERFDIMTFATSRGSGLTVITQRKR